jgi:hypothetical protein
MSDRAIGHSSGLAAKTVAAIRKTSQEETAQSGARIGLDGKVRPLDSRGGRRRAAELLAQQPDASLRVVARAVGISPATVLDVRKRMERGEPPVPEKPAVKAARGDGAEAGTDSDGAPAQAIRLRSRPAATPDPATAVGRLLRDPSLRHNDRGKEMLRLLRVNAVGAEQLQDAATSLPPHCVGIVVQLAHQYASMWQAFARELDGRARIIDPAGDHTLSRR